MKNKKMYITIGEYKKYIVCRFCGKKSNKPVINLGDMPLAGGFIKNDKKNSFLSEKFYPLELSFCTKCYLLQTNSAIDRDILFKKYYYFSSAIKTLVSHFKSNAKLITKLLKNKRKGLIVEIGCNDGTFISELSKNGFSVLGVDPAENIVSPLIKKGFPIVNDYFSEILSTNLVNKYGRADTIISFHTLAHIEDMHDVIKGVKNMLNPDGFLAFEVHYLGDLINGLQYDMIYHEHQFYYSLHSLMNFFKTHDMEIFDIKPTPIRTGSMMYFVQKTGTGKRRISQNVERVKLHEEKLELQNIKTFRNFMHKIEKQKKDLLTLLRSLKKSGKTIVGYGASGRGTITMNYSGLTQEYLDYVVDDAPAKQGAFTPGNHLRISHSSILNGKNRPDYVLLFAWPFYNEVLKKNAKYSKSGGRFIIPLPEIKII